MAIISAPQPRYRIYTQLNSYASMLRDIVFGRVCKGPDVEIFEEALCDKFKIPNAVCVPMARVGIYLTLKHLIKPGQSVIMSPYTVSDIVNMVICAGGVPVFADTEQHSCNIDPNEVVRLMDSNTGAVLITHLHGIAAPTYDILAICRKRGVPLVEDAAQAFGATENGKRLGTIGDAGIYSLGMYKNINTWYGGAVVSDNKELIDKIKSELNQYQYQSTLFILKRMLKGFSIDIATFPTMFKSFTYWIFRYGHLHDIEWINRKVRIELDTSRKDTMPPHYLCRLTPFQARLGLSQLDQIDSDNEIRNRNAALYREGLRDIPELVLPPKENGSSYIYTYFPVQYEDRDNLIRWLMLHKRDVAPQHLRNCADIPSFSAFYRDCPTARKTANTVVLLPTYPRYSVSDVEKNIDVIRSYVNK